MYCNGRGTDQDIPKGKELWMRAAALGHVGAMIGLKDVDRIEGNTTPTFTPSRTSCSFCRSVFHSEQEIELDHEGADDLIVVVPGQGMVRTTSRRHGGRNSVRRGIMRKTTGRIFKKDRPCPYPFVNPGLSLQTIGV